MVLPPLIAMSFLILSLRFHLVKIIIILNIRKTLLIIVKEGLGGFCDYIYEEFISKEPPHPQHTMKRWSCM